MIPSVESQPFYPLDNVRARVYGMAMNTYTDPDYEVITGIAPDGSAIRGDARQDKEDMERNTFGDEAFCDACSEYHTDTNRDHPVKWLG